MSVQRTEHSADFDTVSAAVKTLHRSYVENETIDHAFGLETYTRPFEEGIGSISEEDELTRKYQIERIRDRASWLVANSPCDVRFDVISVGITNGTDREVRARIVFATGVLAVGAVLTDCRIIYPDIDAGEAESELNRAINLVDRPAQAARALRSAASTVYDLTCAIKRGHKLWDELQNCRLAHPADDHSEVRERVRSAIETGDPEAISKLRDKFVHLLEGVWTQKDLMCFHPYEFEGLLADLWAQQENATKVTQSSQDHGIDVIVRRPNGNLILIQAKRYQEGNRVGIHEVQRTAGLLVEFPASRAILVSSSDFTTVALEAAERMDDVTLVDGDQLVRLLTDSNLAPPI